MARTPTRTSTRATSDGFTLVELTLVVLIVGILMSMALPRLTILAGERLDSGARRLATLIRYLHDEAALRGTVYRLTLDLDEASWAVHSWSPLASSQSSQSSASAGSFLGAAGGDTPPAGRDSPALFSAAVKLDEAALRETNEDKFRTGWDPYAAAGALPDGVVFDDVATADSVETTGARALYFLPEGSMENVRIALRGESGRTVELQVDGVTGNVTVRDTERGS